VDDPAKKSMIGIQYFVAQACNELRWIPGGFDGHHVLKGQLRYSDMAETLGEVQVIISSLLEGKKEQPGGVDSSKNVHFSGPKFLSQGLV
jgi:hypothetical protein